MTPAPAPLRLQLAHRVGDVPRCALCHADLEAPPATPCEGCQTLLHPACAAELGGCPTPGCAQRARSTPRSPADPRIVILPAPRGSVAAAGDILLSFVIAGPVIGLIAAGILALFIVGLGALTGLAPEAFRAVGLLQIPLTIILATFGMTLRALRRAR